MNEELISAYLDGELTADEQSQVEHALATDPRLRQMHDDLRTLRQNLQSMPQHKLDAGFAARVMAAAQRAKAEQEQPTTIKLPTTVAEPELLVETHHGAKTDVHPAQHEPMAWRVAVWTIAALAAAVLLVLMAPNRPGDIALLPDARPHRGVEEHAEVLSKKLSKDVPEQFSNNTARDTASKFDGKQPGASNRVAADAFDNVKVQTADPDSLTKDATKPGESTESQAQPKTASFGATGAAPAPPKEQLEKAGGSPPPSIPRGSGRGGLGGGRGGGGGGDAIGSRMAMTVPAVAQREELVVYQLSASKSLSREVVNAALAKNHIELSEASRRLSFNDATDKAAENKFAGAAEKPRDIAPPKPGEEVAADLDRKKASEEDFRELDKTLSDLVAIQPPHVEAIYVEASEEQIKAMIAELEQKSGQKFSMQPLANAIVRQQDEKSKATADEEPRKEEDRVNRASPANELEKGEPERASPKEETKQEAEDKAGGKKNDGVLAETKKAAEQRSFAKRLSPGDKLPNEQGDPTPTPAPAIANAAPAAPATGFREAGLPPGKPETAKPDAQAGGGGGFGKGGAEKTVTPPSAAKGPAPGRVRVLILIDSQAK